MSSTPARPCTNHNLWYSSHSNDTFAHGGSESTSPASSSEARAPSSAASSPLVLPSTCTCPPPAELVSKPRGANEQLADSTSSIRPSTNIPPTRALAIDVLRAEARALLAAAERLSDQPAPSTPSPSPGESFDRALAVALDVLRPRVSSNGKRLRRPKGKLVWCGVGKSGLIGRKLHATSLSLGFKSAFLHPIEALHGDLGIVDRRDVVLVLSHSGATSEVLALTPHLRSRGVKMIAICGRADSELVSQSDAWIDCRLPLLHHPTPLGPPAYLPTTSTFLSNSAIASSASTPGLTPSPNPNSEYGFEEWGSSASGSDCSSFSLRSLDSPAPVGRTERPEPQAQEPEAWATVPAPSSSTTLALALGDALVFTLAHELGHGKDQFALNHPNGDLGRQLRLEREQRQRTDVVAVSKELEAVTLDAQDPIPSAPPLNEAEAVAEPQPQPLKPHAPGAPSVVTHDLIVDPTNDLFPTQAAALA